MKIPIVLTFEKTKSISETININLVELDLVKLPRLSIFKKVSTILFIFHQKQFLSEKFVFVVLKEQF